MNKKLHIVPCDGEWAIRKEGADDILSLHPTQQAAIEQAIDVAQDDDIDVVVHRRDGSFRNVISHETIERRAAESAESGLHMSGKTLAWGLFAAGAVTALAVYLALNPPVDPRRLMRRLDEERPDWMRWS